MIRFVALGGAAALTLAFATAAWEPAAAAAPVRVSLEQFARDPARVASLKRGVAVMKARPPSDPTSWFFQAAIHGVSDRMVFEAYQRDPLVANVDRARFWNTCPHFGQSSAEFLIWHRIYLYYFERILREAAQDPLLALPYWNYSQTNRAFPSLFGDPEADPATGQPTNPLYHADREQVFVAGVTELSDLAVSSERALRESSFFGLTEDQGFAGGVADANQRSQGFIERQPHNPIHLAVGGVIGSTLGSMADVVTAAFDPVFWVHHANVDRLWSRWDCTPGKDWGAIPPLDWLFARPWWFHDADRSQKNPSRIQHLARRTLDITYDTDDPSCVYLSNTVPNLDTLTSAARPGAQPFVAGHRDEIGAVVERSVLPLDRPFVRQIPLRRGGVLEQESLSKALQFGGGRRRVRLEVQGLSYATSPSVGYEVYVNDSHIGGLAMLAGRHVHGSDVPIQTFDVTSLMLTTEEPAAVRVTLVPFDVYRPVAGRPVFRRSGEVTIDALTIAIVEGR